MLVLALVSQGLLAVDKGLCSSETGGRGMVHFSHISLWTDPNLVFPLI